MFKKHLKEQHGIDTDRGFSEKEMGKHLEMKEVLLPVSIFSSSGLSALEAIVKFLRENEEVGNAAVAKILGKSPANTWITYRNAVKKNSGKLSVGEVKVFVPTHIFDSKLSVLESISKYLREEYSLSYAEIGRLLGRNERTIWTVCQRAERKLKK